MIHQEHLGLQVLVAMVVEDVVAEVVDLDAMVEEDVDVGDMEEAEEVDMLSPPILLLLLMMTLILDQKQEFIHLMSGEPSVGISANKFRILNLQKAG